MKSAGEFVKNGIACGVIICFFVYIFFSKELNASIDKNPQTRIKDVIIHVYDDNDNREAARLYGTRLVRDVFSNHVTVFDCTGEINNIEGKARIESKTAVLDNTGNLVTFTGDVVVHEEPDTTLFTTDLFYTVDKNRVYTYSNVMIDEPDRITYGRGLDANISVKKARILNDVRIVMKDIGD